MHGQLFRSTGLVTLAVAALVVAGCSRGESVGRTASAESFAEPVSVTNCDRTETFDAPPQRIVSMNDHCHRGADRDGGRRPHRRHGYGDATPLPEFADAFAKIPKLAKEYPTREQILDLDPDLVVGGMRSAFDEKEGRSRESLGDQGIPTFLFSEYCGQGFPDIGLLRSDYQQLGEILGDPDRARAITDRVTSGLQAVRDEIAGAAPVPTFFYDSRRGRPADDRWCGSRPAHRGPRGCGQPLRRRGEAVFEVHLGDHR